MRKLITGMKISVDGKLERPVGNAGRLRAWSDDHGLPPQIDACVLGLEEIAAHKQQPGKDIYLVGGCSNYGEPYRRRAGR